MRRGHAIDGGGLHCDQGLFQCGFLALQQPAQQLLFGALAQVGPRAQHDQAHGEQGAQQGNAVVRDVEKAAVGVSQRGLEGCHDT
ncbi:hypothetical protein D9M68_876880 [compost metagenome]